MLPLEKHPATRLLLRHDCLAALAAFVFSTLVFLRHLAPGIMLHGEKVTSAYTLGVPETPGFPLWTMLGHVWSHWIVPFGNPAWRINTMSAVAGGLTIGVMALMLTHSTRLLLRSLKWTDSLDATLLHWISLSTGTGASLLFAFNRGVWYWACVPEPRALNTFFFLLTACLFYKWMMNPKRWGWLCATVFAYGLGMATHYIFETAPLMALAIGFGTLAQGVDDFFEKRKACDENPRPGFKTLMASLSSFWEILITALLVVAAYFVLLAWLRTPPGENMPETFIRWHMERVAALYWKSAWWFVPAVLMLGAGTWFKWLKPHRAVCCTLLFLAGCALYVYLPFAAATNPPSNWGFASSKAGFLHMITRGHYMAVQPANPFTQQFLLQMWLFIRGLIGQYSLPLCLFGLVSLGFFASLRRPARAWMIFLWLAFIVCGFGMVLIINPRTDWTQQEIVLQYYAPAHGFFAMLIGYGTAATLAVIARFWKAVPRAAMAMLCLALPLISYTANWKNCALEKNDFGQLFGRRIFSPGGNYPDVPRNAIVFGGTDPGRFVPTYMIYCETNFDRRDVYILTQNALADQTYMEVIRNQYGHSRLDVNHPETLEQFTPWQRAVFKWAWNNLGRATKYPEKTIRIPTPEESSRVFHVYVDDVVAGRLSQPVGMFDEENTVQVTGALAIMDINGIAAKWIFDWNKDEHDFYIEESYPIQWMYPHLRPAGIIMKIEKEPLPSPQQDPTLWNDIIAQDTAYWDALVEELLSREEFLRSDDAKKTFSKLRTSIAGIYLHHRLLEPAEYALKQAMQLCPEGCEGGYRLVEVYIRVQQRYDEARAILEHYLRHDPRNPNIMNYLERIDQAQQERGFSYPRIEQ